MEEGQKNSSGRPLTTDEIRLKAHKWTLAGDVGLLAYLEQFSENLLKKSQETQKNINELLDSFEDTSTTVNNITNQFLALQNSQFVENRVYDDESPTEDNKPESTVSKEEEEKLLLIQYKEAVGIGIKLLDSHFEEVQLPPNSDSDEEEISVENSGLVWKPKNPYAGKKFPLLIGSAEWWSDDNVGLGEYEENINPDTLLPESESDMEADDNAEKRVRLSTSSSESDRILSKKPKDEINSYHSDIFAPTGKEMFNRQSNLFSEDDDEPRKAPGIYEEKENLAPAVLPNPAGHEKGETNDTYSSKQNNNSIFEEPYNTDLSASLVKPNKFQNAFTKELTAKLSSVVYKSADESKSKAPDHEKPDDSGQSALFSGMYDNDDLFSAKDSESGSLFKKQSIFDGDADDHLFGDGDNLFSGYGKGQAIKKGLKSEVLNESDGLTAKENNVSKASGMSNKVSDNDLFENNDDFLFSGKSVFAPSQSFGELDGGWRESREVKFSTPTEQKHEVPNADIFGYVSEIRSDGSLNAKGVSVASNDMDNSLNYARYENDDTSKDDGFSEPSELSKNKTEKSDSGLFEPKLSSTRHMSHDNSDYKSQKASTNPSLHSKYDSTESNVQSNTKSRMGHSQKPHFSRVQSEASKAIGLFVDDDDDDDDLFQTSKPKQVKENLLKEVDDDDLFSNLFPKESKNHEKEDGSGLFSKSSGLFDGERSIIVDKVKNQDSASMSSSRSSLFDDLNAGKSNMASVFHQDKSFKTSHDLFGAADDDIFSEKRNTNFESDDLFGASVVKSKANNSNKKSLFDDLDDAEDIFGGRKDFGEREDFADLFGSAAASKKDKAAMSKTDNRSNLKTRDDGISAAGLAEELPSNSVMEEPDPLFENKESNEGKSLKVGDKSLFKEEKPKTHSLPVTSIFGELEEEEDDLFSNTKSKNSILSKKLDEIGATTITNKKESSSIFGNSSGESDNLFSVVSPKDKSIPDKMDQTSEIVENIENFSEEKTRQDLEEKQMKVSENQKKEIVNGDLQKNESKSLFEVSSVQSKILESKKFFENDETTEDNLFSSKPFKESAGREKPENCTRPSPPSSLNILKKLDFPNKKDSNHSETDGSAISTEKPKIVGKLNIPTNLKINPMTLLPGAVLKKNVSSENASCQELEPEKDAALEKSETSTNLLKCLSKDRVKIPARRRPQTRRARQEALRSSGIDFKTETETETTVASRSWSVDDFEKGASLPPTIKSSSDTNVTGSVEGGKRLQTVESSSSIFHSVENSPEGLFSSPLPSNPLSPSTDEEDYFNIPELDINFEKEDQSIFKSDDFERGDKGDDTLLFDGAPVLSPLSPTKRLTTDDQKPEEDTKNFQKKTDTDFRSKIATRRLISDEYEDEDDDDNLFKASENVAEKKRTSNIFDDVDESDSFLFQKTVSTNREVLTKSMFDDSDESDDLFSDNKSISVSSTAKNLKNLTGKKNLNKSGAAEKLKEPFVDPLGLMTNPD